MRLTKRQLIARLELGAVNAAELERVFEGKAPRERPPGLLEAIRKVEAADRAAARRRAR